MSTRETSAATPYREIVVGVDEEGRSDHAVRAGLALGTLLDARVRLLHAVRVPGWIGAVLEPEQAALSNSRLQADALEAQTARLAPVLEQERCGSSVSDLLTVLPGPLDRALREVDRRSDVDLCVLGPHARRGTFDFGSTARSVLAVSGCDVWLQPGPFEPPRRVLAPIDFSETSHRALETAVLFAKRFGARVTVLHAFEPFSRTYPAVGGLPVPGGPLAVEDLRKAALERERHAMEEVDWNGVEHDDAFVEGHAVTRILALEDSVDLIVMGTHGRTRLSSAVLGSVAYGVLRKARRPVLAVRHPGNSWRD